MPMYINILHRANEWLRLFQVVGAFVSTIFYVTHKIMAINVLATVTNLITMFLLINFEINESGNNDWDSDTEKYGASPIWIYSVAIITPLLLLLGCTMLKEQTGLILVDND